MKKTSNKRVKRSAVKGYEGSLKVLRDEVKLKGSSPSEIIENLSYKGKFPTKGVLTITNLENNHSVYRIIPQQLGNRLFNLSPLMREIALKNLKLLFNGF